MKFVVKEVIKTEVKERCCTAMDDLIDKGIVEVDETPEVVVHYQNSDDRRISFCPFCGEPIKLTEKKLGKKR